LLLVVVSLELWRQRRELKDRINQQWRVFEGLAGSRGLDASDIAFLKDLHAGMESLHSPDVLIRIPAVYDRALESWIGDKSLSPEQWTKLARIRRLLGFKGLTGETSLSHTRQMTDGQIIRLAPEGGDIWVTARVVNNNEDCIEAMPDEHLAWSAGSEIRLAFSRQGDGEYKATVRLIRKDADSPALVLGHSAKLSRQQLRMWVRVPVFLEGKMRDLTDSDGTPLEPAEFPVHLLDLSGGGTMASAPVELPVESRGVLDFKLGETMVEGVRFILLRNGKPAKDGGHTCHLCWDGIEISAQERIMRFVFERQRLGSTAR
jgi:c-di-GMP-binding flagellar brake protein YcgR